MNRLMLLLSLAALLVTVSVPAPACGKDGDEYDVMAKRLNESERFRAWVAAVASHTGWRAPEDRKANHNRVRVHGVCWTPEAVVVALPNRAMTVDGQPEIRAVRLEYGEGEMRRMAVPDFARDDVTFWLFCGSAPDDRFQFSLDLAAGPTRWG